MKGLFLSAALVLGTFSFTPQKAEAREVLQKCGEGFVVGAIGGVITSFFTKGNSLQYALNGGAGTCVFAGAIEGLGDNSHEDDYRVSVQDDNGREYASYQFEQRANGRAKYYEHTTTSTSTRTSGSTSYGSVEGTFDFDLDSAD